MDKHFFDLNNFVEPKIHKTNLDIIYMNNDGWLSKKEVKKYYNSVKEKLNKYLSIIDDAMLEEYIEYKNKKLTRLEWILAQFRHIFYHVGYFHCCIKLKKGETPEYIGVYKTIPISS